MMKTVFPVLVLFLTAPVFAQDTAFHGHYEIISAVDYPSTALLAAELEQRFEAYNRLFRFDPSMASLKVRFFASAEAYNGYVEERRPGHTGGAVYLHYGAGENRELVICKGEEDAIASQAFIQFLRAFIPNPPLWMLEGFAVYFNKSPFDRETKTVRYEENLSWLSRIKKLDIPAAEILAGQAPENSADFQALSWALVSFFLADKQSGYYRTLTDSFMILDPALSSAGNGAAVYKRVTLFTDMAAFQTDFTAYIASLKTFADLLDEGQRASAAKDYAAAGAFFREAIGRRPGRWEPYYYLGVGAYEQKDYGTAEQYYAEAFSRNADGGLVQYARGVNAAAANKKTEAAAFLEEAAAFGAYKAMAEDMLKKLK